MVDYDLCTMELTLHSRRAIIWRCEQLEMNVDIAIEVIPAFEGEIDEALLRRAVDLALREANVSGPVELSLIVTDDDELRELNRSYRGLDEPTDVLSFALTEAATQPSSEDAAAESPFVQPPDGITHLGEIFVSYPRAVLQAQEAGHPVKQELALLVAHGVLHLLGYDHAEPEEEAVMRHAQDKVVAEIMST